MPRREKRTEWVARWRRTYWDRIKRAPTDLDGLAVAFDHFRLAAARMRPEDRRPLIDATVADLFQAAEDLLTHYERHGRRAA